MTDPACRGPLEVITAIIPPSWFTDESLRNLLVARMVNLSLEHGNSEASCYAYALLARTLGSYFGDYEAGHRFGTLSLELVDKRGLDRFKTRVYACFGHHIDPWKHHLAHSREWLRLAFAAAPQAGDLTFAAYNCVNTVGNLLASGEPLSNVQVEIEKGLEFARRLAFGFTVDLLIAQRAYTRALLGLTANLADFNDAEFDENQFERHLDGDPQLVAAKFRYWIRKLQAYFHAGDYDSAAAAASKIQELRWRSQSFVEVAEYPFYAALAFAGLYSAAKIGERLRHFDAIVDHHKLLSIWARNCPENFACMEALVAAEIARIQGKDLDAERLYEDSLSFARENRFIHNEALANELAGKFYLGRGLRTIAYTYLRNARYCYLRWMALGKVRLIDQNYRGLTEERTASLSGAGIDGVADRLDQAAVVKALQAISGEIVLGKLIKTLIKIVVEHSGAERGLFLLVRNKEPQIDAEATTIDDRVEVILQTAAVATSTLPGSIVQYVMRTRESVILEDASIRNLFSDDDYLRRRRPKSVLCMPITRQAEVVSILYLENNLTTHAFTTDRIAVLKLLASQGAISLENARLYADLRQAEALLAGEKRVLEMMTRGDSLYSILGALCAVADESCDGWISAILLLDANGKRLWYGAASRLSPDYAQAINGVTVGPDFGPCSTAARLRETIVISDISSDFRWPEYRALALESGLRASWSTPIPSLKGEVMGSFDMYSREPRTPDARELDIIKQMTHHAGVAIQRSQAEDALRKSEEALRASEQVARGQVETLIYSLDVLATASEPDKFLGKMLNTICRQLSGQSAALWLYDEPGESMILQLTADSTSTPDSHENRLLAKSPLSWGKNSGYQQLLFAACPVLCEDTAADGQLCTEMRDYFLMTGVKKFLAVPILAEGRVRGMITVGHAERSPYRTEEVELAQALAHQVMLAIRLTEVGDQSRQAAVLAERNRMARDVHDTLAQGFTGVIVQLEAAQYAISEGDCEDANRHLHQAGELARRSLSEARRSVHALRPQALEEVNFWQALKGMIKSTTVGTTLQTRFEAQGKVPVLPLAWQENLLRIGQEALSNTLKYARAKQFRTRLTSSAKELRLELCDDGDGFRVSERHDGVGLAGMRERVQEMGGELKIASSRDKGTKITVILPKDAVRQPAP
jgi:signal transduction histidine kinase